MSNLFVGVPAAPGRAAGKVVLFDARPLPAPSSGAHSSQRELERYRNAAQDVATRLDAQAASQSQTVSELLAAHRLILHDPELQRQIERRILDLGEYAVAATTTAYSAMAAMVDALDDPYFAARSADVREVGILLVNALTGSTADIFLDTLPAGTILCADDLLPSQVARLNTAHVRAIALRRGSRLAHAAILARSMGIPMVCGVRDLALNAGDACLVDGDEGIVQILDDGDSTTNESDTAGSNGAAQTLDLRVGALAGGGHVDLLGNANTLADVERIRRAGMGGVGLLRTEFLFPRHALPPTLDEQTALFTTLLAAAPDGIFTVRALDAGGDKEIPWLSAARYPGITGRRGVRLLLAEPELLRTQYRALLRALIAANRFEIIPRFLLPMVTDAEEVLRVLTLLDEVIVEEEEEMDDFAPEVLVGAMIEAPAAVLMSPDIAPQCAFLSIGTNDLAHGLFATERAHHDPDLLADPLHPALLRAIAMTCQSAQAYGIPVALCGELASNPLAAPLLVGLGVSELSLRAPSAPLVHAALGRYTQEQCQRVARAAFDASDAATVHQLLAELAAR